MVRIQIQAMLLGISISCLLVYGISAADTFSAASAATKMITKRSTVLLMPTKGNKAQGVVTFTAVEGGVEIVADIDHLEPGKHGFHIHEHGDCNARDGSSIGRHFNPTSEKHGGPDYIRRHVGDLGNIVADDTGHAHYERLDSTMRMDGPQTIIGRSVAIDANADDYTSQPEGNSGGHVACGVIE